MESKRSSSCEPQANLSVWKARWARSDLCFPQMEPEHRSFGFQNEIPSDLSPPPPTPHPQTPTDKHCLDEDNTFVPVTSMGHKEEQACKCALVKFTGQWESQQKDHPTMGCQGCDGPGPTALLPSGKWCLQPCGRGCQGSWEGRHMAGVEDSLPGRLSRWAGPERRQSRCRCSI